MFEPIPEKQLFNIKTGETGFTINKGEKLWNDDEFVGYYSDNLKSDQSGRISR